MFRVFDYISVYFDTECTDRYNYGRNCEKFCNQRKCVTSTVCSKTTGECGAGGCKPGWTGVDCTQGKY